MAIGGPKTGQVALWDYLTLSRMKKTYEDFGFDLAVLEMGFPLEKAKQGLPGAEEEIEVFCQIYARILRAGGDEPTTLEELVARLTG